MFSFRMRSCEPHHEKTCFFACAKTKAQIFCVVAVQLISTFGFTAYMCRWYNPSTFYSVLSKSGISSFKPSSVAVQPALSGYPRSWKNIFFKVREFWNSQEKVGEF